MAAFTESTTFSPGGSVNDGIPEAFFSLDYVTFHAVLDMVVELYHHEERH